MESASSLNISEYKSPLGPITLMATEKGICLLKFGHKENVSHTASHWPGNDTFCQRTTQGNSHLKDALLQLDEYFYKDRQSFQLSYDLYGTDFQKRVWYALQRIPFGEIRTYKDIAKEVESPKAVRAVGLANGKNPISIFIPCHRVIGSNGKLTGYGGGIDKKDFLLRLEGITIKK